MSAQVARGLGLYCGLLVSVGCSTAPTLHDAYNRSLAQDDPFAWLEEIESPTALQWVRTHNEEPLTHLKVQPLYSPIEQELRAIYMAKDRIPYPGLQNGWVYNFWQDAEHAKWWPKWIRSTSPISFFQQV